MSFFGVLFIVLSVSAQAREKNVQAQLELSWEAQPGATSYELELRRDSGKGTQTFRVSKPEFRRVIPVGRYLVRIRSFDGQGSAGEWGPAKAMDVYPPSVELVAPKPSENVFVNEKQDVLFRWKKEGAAVGYTLLIWDEEKNAFRSEETKANRLAMKLPLGKTFYWKVSFRDRKGVVYEDAREPRSFTVIGQRLKIPELELIGEDGEFLGISWRGDPLAQEFQLKLFRKDLMGSDWHPVLEEKVKAGKEQKTSWKSPGSLPAGEYRLEVVAAASTHQPSPAFKHQFLIKPKLSELAEIR